jgi:hypothetical protein
MGKREDATKLLVKGQETAHDKSRPENQDHSYQLHAAACYADPTFGQAF